MKELSGASTLLASCADRPPKPRQSQSPAVRSRRNAAPVEVPIKETSIELKEPSQPCSVSSTPKEVPDVDDSDGFVMLENPTTDYHGIVDICHDVDQIRLDGNQVPIGDSTNDHRGWNQFGGNHLSTRHPFLIPTPSNGKNISKGHTWSSTLDPSMDILAQWRLRRKIEAALAQHDQLDHPLATGIAPLSSNYHSFKPDSFSRFPTPHRSSILEWPYSSNWISHDQPCVHTKSWTASPQLDRSIICRLVSIGTQTAPTHPPSTSFCEASTITIEPPKCADRGCTVDLKPAVRSVRVMAVPCRIDVSTQTESLSQSVVHPGLKSHEQGDIPVQHNAAPSALKTESPRMVGHLLPVSQRDGGDNDAVSESDSWQWTHVSSEFSQSPFCRSPIRTASTPVVSSLNQLNVDATHGKSVIERTSDHPRGNPGLPSAPTDRLNWDAQIMRHMEESADIHQLIGSWKDDAIIQDLLDRRAICLNRLTSVISELRRRELDLVEKAQFAKQTH